MRRSLLVFALLLVPAAPARATIAPEVDPAIADGSAQRALDTAKARWKAAGVRSYRYTLRLSCFCPERGPFPVVVRGGKPGTVPQVARPAATVPRLFARVQDAIDDRVAVLDVSYGTRGVPSSVAIDRSRMIADEEIGYRVERFSTRVRPRT